MEMTSFFSSYIRGHYKAILVLCTATATLYLVKKYVAKKQLFKKKPKQKKKIRDFPTIEEIQNFIKDLPLEVMTSDQAPTLKDLLGELSEFSEDEEWKELIASVHDLYDDQEEIAEKGCPEESGSIMSIYEDPNLITLNGTSPREDTCDFLSLECENEEMDTENIGNGDMSSCINTPKMEPSIEEVEDVLNKNLGEGDINDNI